jgi:carboxypeptidase T
MGYGVEQLQDVAAHLSTFATDEAIAGYHSAAGLERDLRQLKEIGRSIEARAIHVLRIGERRGGDAPKVLFMGCHHAREWIAVEVPFLLAKELVERADDPQIAGWLSKGEIWSHQRPVDRYRSGARKSRSRLFHRGQPLGRAA